MPCRLLLRWFVGFLTATLCLAGAGASHAPPRASGAGASLGQRSPPRSGPPPRPAASRRRAATDDFFDAVPPGQKSYGVPIRQMARLVRRLAFNASAPLFTRYHDAQRNYHALYEAMHDASSAVQNASKYIGAHCSAMKRDFALSGSPLDCRDFFAGLLVRAVQESLIDDKGDLDANPVQISNAVRATQATFGLWPEWAAAREASQAFADAIERGRNVDMCVDRTLACDQQSFDNDGTLSSAEFEQLCAAAAAGDNCCACGGGDMVPFRNQSYDTALPRKVMVWIGGAHYSGTSVLAAVMGASPEVSSFHNTGVTEDEGQHLQDVYKSAIHTGGAEFGCTPTAYLNETDELVTEANARRLWAQWSRLWSPLQDVYLEKSPPDIAKFSFFQALFHRARKTVFLGILRHPLAMFLDKLLHYNVKAYSTISSWAKFQTIVGSELDCWLTLHENMQAILPRLKHAMFFRYEDFMQNVTGYLTRLEALVGLSRAFPVTVASSGAHPALPSSSLLSSSSSLRTTAPPAVPTAPAGPHRRALYFHGDKDQLVVNTTLAGKWLDQWTPIVRDRKKYNAAQHNDTLFKSLSLANRMASILTDAFLAEFDQKLEPFGYSMTHAENVGTLKVFRQETGPAAAAIGAGGVRQQSQARAAAAAAAAGGAAVKRRANSTAAR